MLRNRRDRSICSGQTVMEEICFPCDHRKYDQYLCNTAPGCGDHGGGNGYWYFLWLEGRQSRYRSDAYLRSVPGFSGTGICPGSSRCSGRRYPKCHYCPGGDQLAEVCKTCQRAYSDSEGLRISYGGEAFGNSTGKLLFKHILPNIAGPILVTSVLDIGTMMMELAGLSFLGLGVKPPMAEWGSMINDGRSMLQISPWMVLAPGMAIFITVMIFNLLGDTIRDYMDPKERNRRKG